MRSLNFAFLIVVGSVLSIGCASQVHRGSVAMKTSETEAQVDLGKGEVSEGDALVLYRNDCRQVPAGTRGVVAQNACAKVESGRGQVAEVLNENYSIAVFPPGAAFEKGDIVEKHKH